MSLKSTLLAPKLPCHLSQNAKWLAGEGAGSWFLIQKKESGFEITRYSPNGIIECTGAFQYRSEVAFNITKKYHFTHLSHCKTVKIIQGNTTFVFERIE